MITFLCFLKFGRQKNIAHTLGLVLNGDNVEYVQPEVNQYKNVKAKQK